MAQMSMDSHRSYDDSAHIMNSSFYSSVSMNTLDHAKNFRNSLVMRDSSDQSLTTSLQSGEGFEDSQLDQDGNSVGSMGIRTESKGEKEKEKEIATMQMKNSPSLNALASILNEKSKMAEEKERLNRVMNESILEEVEDGEHFQTNTNYNSLPIDSPNLIDINDNNSVSYPSLPQTINSNLYEQPDFLSTPKTNPPMSRSSNNPFLVDYQLPKRQQDQLFQIHSSIQEEPELELSPVKERRQSMIDFPEFKPRSRSNTVSDLETNRVAEPLPRVQHRSQSSLNFFDHQSVQDPPPMYSRHAFSTSALIQQPEEPNGGQQPKSNNSSTDLSINNKGKNKTRSRASTLGNSQNTFNLAHQRSRTVDDIGTDRVNKNKEKVKFEKNSFQERSDGPSKSKNIQRRTVSAGPVLDESLSQQQPQSQKRRSIFSLFKRRSSKETTPKKSKQTSKRHSTFMPSSTTFNTENNLPPPSTPEKLTKKSHSTNTIFSTFRKNKDKEDLALLSSSTPPKKESQLDAISKESSSFSSVKKDPHTNDSDVEKSRSDPWDEPQLRFEDSEPLTYSRFNEPHPNGSQLSDSNLMDSSDLPEPFEFKENKWINLNVQDDNIPLEQEQLSKRTSINDPSVGDFPKPVLPFLARHDAGEALFPKSLDKHEVESIVSLERSRSIKSNRSHRRSLTDTLSVNAQNEGMYVTEASPAVISTPDLSKSPTGSILRNGRFDSITPSNLDDKLDKENSESIPQLTLSPQGDSTMGSIEGKFNQLVLMDDDDDDDDIHEIGEVMPASEAMTEKRNVYDDYSYENDIRKEAQEGEDEQGFTNEMIEFASLINFGDDFHLDIDTAPDQNTNVDTGYDHNLQQSPPRRITNAKPAFVPEAEFEPVFKDTSNEQVTNRPNQNSAGDSDKNVARTVEEQIPNGSSELEENHSITLNKDEQSDVSNRNENGFEHNLQTQPMRSSTDIPNDLLDEIRSPSPSPSLQTFGPLHEYQETHKERHSFRDILTPPVYASDQQPNHRPLSMSFKGLGAPSLNQNFNDTSSFSLPMTATEISGSGSPMQPNSRVNFSSKIVLYDTYNLDEYDRRPELATCNMLTPQLAQAIKTELNELKTEMDIHEASRCYTHFF